MPSVERLLNEAQFALGNISPGSTRETRYRKKTERLLRRIVQKYPATTEATQARSMQDQLRGIQRVTVRTPLPHTAHKPASSHRAHKTLSKQPSGQKSLSSDQVSKIANDIRAASKRTFATSTAQSWGTLWQKYAALSYVKKKSLAFVLLFVFLIVAAMPFLLLGLIFYAAKPSLLRDHLHALLDSLS